MVVNCVMNMNIFKYWFAYAQNHYFNFNQKRRYDNP